MSDDNHSLKLTAGIVAAYVEKNAVQVEHLPKLILSVHQTLAALGTSSDASEQVTKASPAQIRASITPEALISFENGKRYKHLRRHLTKFGLKPEDYRAKWGLPLDYPVVAANYSAQRSALAKALGLGKKKPLAPDVEAPTQVEPAAKVRFMGKLGLFGRRSQS